MAKILVVDDEKSVRSILVRVLENEGFECVQADSVAEARARLNEENFVLVFTDMYMLEETGLDLLRYIQENFTFLPVIMVTIVDNPTFAKEALSLGVYGYITKPLDSNQVLIQLFNALHRNELEKQNWEYRENLERLVKKRTQKLDKTIKQLETVQQSLRESETKFRSITTYAKDGIVMMDQNTYVTYWNQAAEKIFGFSSEEVIGKKLHSLIAPSHYKSAYTKGLKEFKQTGEGGAVGQTVELTALRKDGSQFPVELSISSAKLNNNWTAIGIIRDISERKKFEEIEKRRASYASLIYNVGQRLSHKLNLDELLDEIVVAIREAFNYYSIMVFITDEDKQKLVLRKLIGGYVKLFPKDMAFDFGEGMIGIAAHTAETQIALDVTKNVHYIRCGVEKTKSELAVPIKNKNKVIGVLDLQSIHKNAFDDLDVEAMETLCIQIAIEIENTQLFENMQNEILDRKQAEVALRQSEERFQRIVNVVEDVLYIVDGESREFSYLSPAFKKIFGYTEEDIRNMGGRRSFLSKVLIGNDFNKQEDKFDSLSDQPKEDKVYWESWWRCKDGTLVCIEDHSAPVYANSRLVGTFGILHDITARKKMEEELRNSEMRMKKILETVQAGIVIIDANTKKVLDINSKALSIIGVKKADVLNTPCEKYICSLQEKACSISKTAETIQNAECSISRTDGEKISIIKNVVLIEINNQKLLIESFVDISKLKATEKALSQAQKLESIGQLAAGIAHEINTPMQYIGDNTKFFKDAFDDINRFIEKFKSLKKGLNGNGADQTIVHDLEKVSKEVDLDYLVEEIPHSITETLEGVNRVTQIVRSMKEFSHPGSKEKSFIDINHALESTITVSRNEWKYAADLETKFDSTLPMVNCLPGELNQVFLNIIINAAHTIKDVIGENSDQKGKITVETHHKEKYAEIRISDTGTGIPENLRNKIFDPFFTTKEVGKGTGQGLYIAHDIICNKHNGRLTIESEVGKGTTFIIELPIE